MTSTVVITRLDGTTYDLNALGFHVKKFDVPYPNFQYTFQSMSTYHNLLVDRVVQQTTISLVLDITANDTNDFELQKLKLRRILRSNEEFYVQTMRMPFLRWKVVADTFTPAQNNSFWRASDVQINLECTESYAETVATTLTPMNATNGLWGFGLEIPSKKKLEYEFNNQTEFDFMNLGIIPLNADERPVRIIFKGNANNLKITNTTTNQSYSISGSLSKNDTLEIVGLVPIINGSQAYGRCNHAYLDFAVGKNHLRIEGSSDFNIKFDTRFYY